jgi:WD40 repeat protein
VKIWDLAARREQASFRAHEGWKIIQAAVFSPDGTLLVTAGLLDREVRLWDAATCTPRGTLPAPENFVRALAFSPRDPILAMAGGDGVVSLWDVVRRQRLGTLGPRGVSLLSVAFSPDGRRLATGGRDGTLRLWDLTRVISSDAFRGPSDPVR